MSGLVLGAGHMDLDQALWAPPGQANWKVSQKVRFELRLEECRGGE